MSERATLFLCGDVMTGRGIDQALPHPGDPRLHEPNIRNASDYVALAECANGPLPRPIDFNYIWGDALEAFEREQPGAKIINLETAIANRRRQYTHAIVALRDRYLTGSRLSALITAHC